ncbi:MAG: type II toxin-antitoxin system RelE/ParE family toxin [Candidatus Margulisbacteria bacterium]|jgi:putative addiction module killer protein|nr:type II toxin-antitoxin system RelE/ParE family toxin [Candidatus Margulisiibacteriota bacterium]
MIKIEITEAYKKWFNGLKDFKAKNIINVRLDRIREGNFGDRKTLGGGLYEVRIHYGNGYRLYFVHKGEYWVLILCGGEKSTQSKDIEKARKFLKEVKQ